MKTTILMTVFALCFGLAASAQSLKIGYTNADYILSLMPEYKQIMNDLQSYEKQLAGQLQAKQEEFNTKLEAFNTEAPSMAEQALAEKQGELQQLQQEIIKFQGDAQTALQTKQRELFTPAYDKIQNAIDVVASREGYTHVFSSDAAGFPILLYAANDQDNISNIVLKELGIEAPPAE